MNVYTRIDGKLAMFEVQTDDPAEAIQAVGSYLTDDQRIRRQSPLFAVILGGKNPCTPQKA